MLAHGYTCTLDTTVPQRCMRPPGKKLQRCWARVNAIAGGCSEDRGVLAWSGRGGVAVQLDRPYQPAHSPAEAGRPDIGATYRHWRGALPRGRARAAGAHGGCAHPSTLRCAQDSSASAPQAGSSRPSIRFHLQRYLAGRLNYVKVEYSWWTTRTRPTRWM